MDSSREWDVGPEVVELVQGAVRRARLVVEAAQEAHARAELVIEQTRQARAARQVERDRSVGVPVEAVEEVPDLPAGA